MNVILELLKAGNLILTLEPIALDAAMKLKALFTGLSPDLAANIKSLSGEAISADDATEQLVAAWQKQHGLPVTIPPPAADPAPIVD